MKVVKKILALLLMVLFMVAVNSSTAKATFNHNRIIDDIVFDDKNSLTATQIDNFLNGFGSSCIKSNSGFRSIDPTGYSPSTGYTYGGYTTAGTVIYHAAQAYDINPKVLLTTLQKEQSLVTGTAGCSILRYVGAMGYGCPDSGTTHSYSGLNLFKINNTVYTSVSGTCVSNASMAGFTQQVIRGAWLLKFGEQRSEGNINWAIIRGNWNNSDDPQSCYGGPMTTGTWQRCPSGATTYYDGYTSIDGVSTHMDNGATASLYWYTPHFAGNQSFTTIFVGWFGSPYAGPIIVQGDDGSPEQYVLYGGRKYWITNTTIKSAWGFNSFTVYQMSASYLQNLPSGENIGGQYARDWSSGAIYIIDRGTKYHIYSSLQLANWGSPAYINVPAAILNMSKYSGGLPNAVQPEGSSGVYMIDGGTMRHISTMNVFRAWEGRSASIMTMSNTLFNNFTLGTGITTVKFTINSKHYIASEGIRYNLGTLNSLYVMSEMSISPTNWVNYWNEKTIHPFVKSEASTSVFIIENGLKRHIASTKVLYAWRIGNDRNITTLSESTINSISVNSNSIDGYIANDGLNNYLVDGGMYKPSDDNQQLGSANLSNPVSITTTLQALYIQNTLKENIKILGGSHIYQLINGKKAHYTNSNVYRLWNGPSRGYSELDGYVIDTIFSDYGIPMSAFFSDGINEYVMSSYGTYYTVSNQQKTAYGLSAWAKPLIPSWLMAEFSSGGSWSQKAISGSGTYYFAALGKLYKTTDTKLSTLWSINASTVLLSADFENLIPNTTLTAFVHVISDNRLFYQNHDNLIQFANMSNAYNLGYNRQVVDISAADLPVVAPSITAIHSPIIKNGVSTYFIIDNSVVRNFTDTTTKNQWVGTDTNIPIASSELLAYLKVGTSVSKSVKASGTDKIYAGISQQLNWIRSSASYHISYEPYTTVNPELINAFPKGADIP